MITKAWIGWKLRDYGKLLRKTDLGNESLADLNGWARNFRAFVTQLYPNGSDLADSLRRVMVFPSRSPEDSVDPTTSLTGPTNGYVEADDPTHPLTRLDYKRRYYSEFQLILDEMRSTRKLPRQVDNSYVEFLTVCCSRKTVGGRPPRASWQRCSL